MGLTGLNASVRFIPLPVIIGFTNCIAILIAFTKIKNFFGLRTGAVPRHHAEHSGRPGSPKKCTHR